MATDAEHQQLLDNQKTILENQQDIKTNQASILGNQQQIKSNQDKLELDSGESARHSGQPEDDHRQSRKTACQIREMIRLSRNDGVVCYD